MDLLSVSLFALALLVAAGTPGPSIAALVSRVITHGWRDVAPFVAAMWLGEVIWLSFAVTGLTALAQHFQLAFTVLKYAGVAYLCWLAWKMWRAPVGGAAALPSRRSGWSMFAAGMAVTMGNPKIMMFYVALLPSLIDVSVVGPGRLAVLACVAVACISVVDAAWILAAHHARRMLQSPKALRVANRVGAATMGGAALGIAARG